MKKITILGGYSGFGAWLVDFILEKFPQQCQITVSGPNQETGISFANSKSIKYVNNNIKAVIEADIVFYAVPISVSVDVIKETGPHIKPGTIVSDVTSTKMQTTNAMQEFCKNCIIIPSHPIFGPFVKNINGQVVVLTADSSTRKTQTYKRVCKKLKEFDFKLVQTTAPKHDKIMSVIQGLTSFSLYTMGLTLTQLKTNLQLSGQFTSPIYKIMSWMISRYINQNPGLYADIQIGNDDNIKMHKVYLKSAKFFAKAVKSKDRELFIAKANEISEFFGSNAKSGQAYTDKLIYLMAKQSDKLKNNINNEILIENIYSKKSQTVKLISFDENSIICDKGNFDINEWIVY